MVSAKVIVKNPMGLHLRPASVLSETALRYKAKISFKYKHNIANVKSILSILGSCVKADTEIELICEGEDEEAALDAIRTIIESEFEDDFG